MKYLKTFWLWLWIVVTGAIGSLLAWAITEGRLSWLKGFGIWLWEAIRYGWQMLGQDVSVVRWQYWVLIACFAYIVLGILRVVYLVFWGRRQTTYRDYYKDIIFGLTWRWAYHGQSIDRHWCYCPKCDRQLVINEAGNYGDEIDAVCDTCGTVGHFKGRQYEFLNQAEREITRKLRTGEWKAIVEAQRQPAQ